MSLTRLWVRLSERAAAGPGFGPKWVTLALLAQREFPVPDAVLLPAGLLETPPESALGAALAALPPSADLRGLAAWGRAAQDVRCLLEREPLPEPLRTALGAALEITGPGPAAVRAAPLPHPGEAAAPAGLFDSFLNLVGPDAAADAVRRVWASRWGAAALQERGGRPLRRLGVMVQRMAPAAASGIALSHAPGGRRHALLILAVWGLGEALASGIAAPDTFWASRSDGELLDRQREERGLMVTARPEGGVAVVPVPAAHGDLPVLRPRQVQELATLAMDVEQALGGPQDIEWALADGRFWLLGSRPQGSG